MLITIEIGLKKSLKLYKKKQNNKKKNLNQSVKS